MLAGPFFLKVGRATMQSPDVDGDVSQSKTVNEGCAWAQGRSFPQANLTVDLSPANFQT